MAAPAPPVRVRPRILLPLTGEPAPLDDEIHDLLARGRRGRIALVGPSGSGKSWALQHLFLSFARRGPLRCFDAPELPTPADARDSLAVYAAQAAQGADHVAIFRLAPWTRDECLDYLRAVHGSACASVMSRLCRAPGSDPLAGLPALWRPVLDEMAADPSLPDPCAALLRALERGIAPGRLRAVRGMALAGELCLPQEAQEPAEVAGVCPSYPADPGPEAGAECEALLTAILRSPARVLLARDAVLEELAGDGPPDSLRHPFPPALVGALAAPLSTRPDLLARLRGFAEGLDPTGQPTAASLLHAARTTWEPERGTRVFASARLREAAWDGKCLDGARLSRVDLTRARIRHASLKKAVLRGARLVGARLDGTCLEHAELGAADLSLARLRSVRAAHAVFFGATLAGADLARAMLVSADLEAADLRRACLAGADLSGATLERARVAGADFTGALLVDACLVDLDLSPAEWRGARFTYANLSLSRLVDLDLPEADFLKAHLFQSDLTGLRAPRSRFRQAVLREARLADIDWEGADLRGADLRGADLRGATFHLGTSRSGLVGSPLACEGSRTGFYADDRLELVYRRPEEVRRANLCGADLRGAILGGADLYLVDLREARLDRPAHSHARRCGAILDPR